MDFTIPPDKEYRHTVAVCEMLYGQPETYYHRFHEMGVFERINFNSYYVMITGLSRHVYRPYFGISAFNYTEEYYEIEKEIRQMLKEQHVSCIAAMLLYDHSKRMCLLFNKPDGISALDIAETVSSCFNRLYARIFDMSKTPYRNYTVLSEEISGYENLTKVFQEIDALSRQQYFDMRTMVMTPSLLESLRVPADPEEVHEDLIKMYVAMRAGETAEMLERYHTVMGRLERARDFDLLEDALSSLRRTLEGVLRSHGVEPDEQMRGIFAIENGLFCKDGRRDRPHHAGAGGIVHHDHDALRSLQTVCDGLFSVAWTICAGCCPDGISVL